MLKIAVCDDELFMRNELSDQLSIYMNGKQDMAFCVSCFEDGRSLLESEADFDLIFLDIQMEYPDGMETARRLRQRSSRSLLVFVTVLKECVFDAFEVDAYDYLIKPLDEAHFKRTMDRVIKTLEQRSSESQSIVVQKGKFCRVIPLSQIVYCEALNKKIYIHQEDGEVIDYYEKLEKFISRIDGRFFRCHRSYLVNLDHVRGYDNGQVLLSQGVRIPVSRLREQELTQVLLRHMRERNASQTYRI